MKHLSTHKYQLECLQHKLAKMTADLDKGLAAANSQLRAKDLFSSCRHPQDIEEREQ